MNQSFDLALRQLSSVMLTRYVEEHWSKTDAVVATDQAKRMIRSILPNGLYDPNSKIRTSVAYTISTIATLDWPNTWTELFDIIVKCLGGNEDSIHGAMQVLIEFTYDLDSQIGVVGPIIISEVYRIFEAEQVYNVKTRTCAVKIFKSLFKSINEHIESKEKQEQILNPILPGLIEKLIYSLSNPNGRLSSFTLKTEIIKGENEETRQQLSVGGGWSMSFFLINFILIFQCSSIWSTKCRNSYNNLLRRFYHQFGSYLLKQLTFM